VTKQILHNGEIPVRSGSKPVAKRVNRPTAVESFVDQLLNPARRQIAVFVAREKGSRRAALEGSPQTLE